MLLMKPKWWAATGQVFERPNWSCFSGVLASTVASWCAATGATRRGGRSGWRGAGVSSTGAASSSARSATTKWKSAPATKRLQKMTHLCLFVLLQLCILRGWVLKKTKKIRSRKTWYNFVLKRLSRSYRVVFAAQLTIFNWPKKMSLLSSKLFKMQQNPKTLSNFLFPNRAQNNKTLFNELELLWHFYSKTFNWNFVFQASITSIQFLLSLRQILQSLRNL